MIMNYTINEHALELGSLYVLNRNKRSITPYSIRCSLLQECNLSVHIEVRLIRRWALCLGTHQRRSDISVAPVEIYGFCMLSLW